MASTVSRLPETGVPRDAPDTLIGPSPRTSIRHNDVRRIEVSVLATPGTRRISLGTEGTIGAGLYYLVHSSFAGAALFLLADLIRRRRGRAGDRKDVIAALPDKTVPGLLFLVVAVSLAGLPPLSGFIGKLLLLEAVPEGLRTFWIWLLVLGTSFLMLIGLARAGTRLFWRTEPWPNASAETHAAFTPASDLAHAPSRPLEIAAIVLLLGYGVALVLAAAPVLDYARATASQLLAPADYVRAARAVVPTLREP